MYVNMPLLPDMTGGIKGDGGVASDYFLKVRGVIKIITESIN